MKKPIVRREFLKLKNRDIYYKDCQKILEERFGKKYTTRTLKNWRKRHNTTDWDLNDASQKPKRSLTKFSEEDKKAVERIRKNLVMVRRKQEFKHRMKELKCLFQQSKG